MKRIWAITTALLLWGSAALATPYGTLVPTSPSDATLEIPNSTSCTDTDEGHVCSDTDDNTLRVGPDVYYSGEHTTDTNTNASTECSGTTTYLDGEGNCDDISSVYSTGAHTTDTGPSPDCSGTGVYQDGEGNCDDTTAFVITCTGGDVLGTDCGSGYDFTLGFVVQIASGTVTLPAVGTGYYGCFKATTAAAITIDPNANDRIILDGTAGADGEYITSTGTIDDTICIYADSSAGWTTMFNPDEFTAQ